MKSRILSIITIWLLTVSVGWAGVSAPIIPVSDEAYNATTWNGITGIAPSKNAVRDKIEAILPTGAVVGTTDTQTLTNKAIVNPEVDAHTTGTVLTAAQVSGTYLHQCGQGANNVNVTLPAAAAGYGFLASICEPSSSYFRVTAAAAGTMIVDGVYFKDYFQFSTPAKGDKIACSSLKMAPGPAGILTGAALAIGSDNTAVAHGAFNYYIAGTKYSKVANAVGVAPGNDVVPQGTYGAVAFDIDSAGTITAVEAADNATGYASAALAIAGIPPAAATKARMGTVTAMKSDGAFTFGTTSLLAGNTTVANTSTAAYTAIYGWTCSTGQGTVTTN